MLVLAITPATAGIPESHRAVGVALWLGAAQDSGDAPAAQSGVAETAAGPPSVFASVRETLSRLMLGTPKDESWKNPQGTLRGGTEVAPENPAPETSVPESSASAPADTSGGQVAGAAPWPAGHSVPFGWLMTLAGIAAAAVAWRKFGGIRWPEPRGNDLFAASGEALLILNAELSVIDANRAARQLLRLDGAVRGRKLSKVVQLPDEYDLAAELERQPGGPLDTDATLGASEEKVPLQLRVSRLAGQDRLLCLVMDVTERREREGLVQRMQQIVLDEMPFDVAAMTPQGRYVFASTWTAVSAGGKQAVIGNTDVEVCSAAGYHSEVAVRRRAQRKQALASKQPVRFEEVLSVVGSERHIVRYFIPILDRQGEVAMILSYGTDVTDEHRLFRDLSETTAEVERLRRMKDSFLNNVNHELRTPLTGILGVLQILEFELSGEQRELVTIAVRNGERLLKTLGDVLELAEMQALDVEIHLRVINIVEEVEAVVSESRKSAEEKQLFLNMQASQTEVWSRLDETCFRRALGQVIDNAIKFTETGGVVVDVEADESKVLVRVMDSGVGMADQYLERAFKGFEQESDGDGRQFEGLGIGLAITERLIARMDGTISVHTEKAGGTMITMTFPRAGVQSKSGRNGRPRLLVVERDADEQRLLRYVLDPFCDAVFATEADRVVDLVEEGRCDGVLINVAFAQERESLVARLRALSEVRPVRLIGIGAAAHTDRFRSLGFDDYLPKPVTKKAVVNALQGIAAGGDSLPDPSLIRI